MNSVLGDMENVEVSMDDILIYAETLNKLKEVQSIVIKKLSEKGIVLNPQKSQYEQQRVKFLGHYVSAKGLEIDPVRIEAIDKLKVPENKTEIQRFLGFINYLSKFIPNMSEITFPIRKLLEKNIDFVWDEEQNQAFIKLKELLKSAPILKFYDVNEDVLIETDASSYALGAVLMQNRQPVAYATKALSKSEMALPQIEKEALAIRFACNKFRDFVYGKKLTVESDHKPLESIFKKPIVNAPPRLQRILMDVCMYSPKVVYKKGKQMYIADTLSRDCNNEGNHESEEQLEILSINRISSSAIKDLQDATKDDGELKILHQIILNGWPEKVDNVPLDLRQYFNYRDEISYFEGLLYKGQKVIILKSEKNLES